MKALKEIMNFSGNAFQGISLTLLAQQLISKHKFLI